MKQETVERRATKRLMRKAIQNINANRHYMKILERLEARIIRIFETRYKGATRFTRIKVYENLCHNHGHDHAIEIRIWFEFPWNTHPSIWHKVTGYPIKDWIAIGPTSDLQACMLLFF